VYHPKCVQDVLGRRVPEYDDDDLSDVGEGSEREGSSSGDDADSAARRRIRNFICVDCDVEGSSKYLMKYFMAVDDRRGEHACHGDFVRHLLERAAAEFTEDDGSNAGDAGAEGSGNAQADLPPAKRRRGQQQPPPRPSSTAKNKSADGDPLSAGRLSELTHFARTHDASMAEVKDPNSLPSPDIGGTRSVPRGDALDSVKSHDGDAALRAPPDPGMLVGRPVLLYCSVDNYYHRGRIVDWRMGGWPNEKSEAPKTGKDADSLQGVEFLVRFRPGLDGRKVPVHQWIYPEEHAVAVGLSVVWAKEKKGRPWWPGQVLCRSALEVLSTGGLKVASPVYEKEKDVYAALTCFFGDDSRCVLDVRSSTVDLFSPSFVEQMGKVGDRAMAVSIAMAIVENEETRRLQEWCALPLNDAMHRRALAMADQDALPPLVPSGGSELTAVRTAGKDGWERSVVMEESYAAEVVPGACPLVERGLDRSWLLKESGVERSKDAAESMECAIVAPSIAIAEINRCGR